MDKLQIENVDEFEVARFNPDWLKNAGEFITYFPKVRVNQLVTVGQPIASMETCRCITTVTAPFTGKVTFVDRGSVDGIKNRILFTFKRR